MFDYSSCYLALRHTRLEAWLDILPAQLEAAFQQGHGRWPEWRQLIAELPVLSPSSVDLCGDIVRIGRIGDCSEETVLKLERHLQALHPWRKGPFSVFGVVIDSEWRCERKWARLRPHIQPLQGRRVLDIGCGNGYYALRMYGEGAALVIGMDPGLLYVCQFYALRHYLGDIPVHVLPLGFEALPQHLAAFDTVFSMGVFYHRRSPLDHLMALRHCLAPGGELVLETLVIEGDSQTVLVPPARYAKMRNVWFIPSCQALLDWLGRCGFHHVHVVDVSMTLCDEQRRTPWMRFESLADFLEPGNPEYTVEGHPAPRRAIFIASA